MKKSFILIGGNFYNKGAQAMTFITIDELRKRYPDCRIHVYSNLDYRSRQKDYDFQIYDDLVIQISGIEKIKYLILSFVKAVLGRTGDLKSIVSYSLYKKKYTAMIDISGYCLTSRFKRSEYYLKNIELAQKNGVPVFLMPQSFGPFEYGAEQPKMDKLLSSVLKYPEKIFAREKEGYDFLTQKYGLSNTVHALDIVLQSKIVDFHNIFKAAPQLSLPEILTENNVAVVPNMRNFNFSNKDKNQVLQIYCKFVEEVLTLGKNVYLLRHSDEDIIACREIKKNFEKNNKVVLIVNSFNCFEYEEMVKNFEYLIASRFHSIVHAYKVGVPCIIMGWATKYQELAHMFNQEKYVFDVREDVTDERIHSAILDLNKNYMDDKKNIGEILEKQQGRNCFDTVAEMLNNGGI